MNTETKLKAAAEEIKDILRKHDLAGAVSLHSPGHGEYFIHLNPSYSNAYIYNENEVRFYSKREDFKTLEEQMKKQADTSNMLNILMNITSMNFGYIQQMSKVYDKLVNAEHS